MGQEVAGSDAVRGKGVGGFGVKGVEVCDVGRDAESPPQGNHRRPGGGLVQREPHGVAIDWTQVETLGRCRGHDLRGSTRYSDSDGVEEVLGGGLIAGLAQPGGCDGRQAVNPSGDPGQPFGTVIDGIHGGHHR